VPKQTKKDNNQKPSGGNITPPPFKPEGSIGTVVWLIWLIHNPIIKGIWWFIKKVFLLDPDDEKPRINTYGPNYPVKDYVDYKVTKNIKRQDSYIETDVLPEGHRKTKPNEIIVPPKQTLGQQNEQQEKYEKQVNCQQHLNELTAAKLDEIEQRLQMLSDVPYELRPHIETISEIKQNPKYDLLHADLVLKLDKLLTQESRNRARFITEIYRNSLQNQKSRGMVSPPTLEFINTLDMDIEQPGISLSTLQRHPLYTYIDRILLSINMWNPDPELVDQEALALFKAFLVIKLKTWKEYFTMVRDLWKIFYYGYHILNCNTVEDYEGYLLFYQLVSLGPNEIKEKVLKHYIPGYAGNATTTKEQLEKAYHINNILQLFSTLHNTQMNHDIGYIDRIWKDSFLYPTFASKANTSLVVLDNGMYETWQHAKLLANLGLIKNHFILTDTFIPPDILKVIG
jgi:hypothetical protein